MNININQVWNKWDETFLPYSQDILSGCTFLPFSQRLVKLSLHSLRHRRIVTDLSTLYSLISGHTFASLYPHVIFISPSVKRSHNLQIYVPTHNFNPCEQNFLSLATPTWNNLPYPSYRQPNPLDNLETIYPPSSLTRIVYNSSFFSSCFIVIYILCHIVLLR